MTAREFLETVVKPNITDFKNAYGSLRHGSNAVAALDALAAHIFIWCKTNALNEIAGITDDSHYRETLSKKNTDFGLLRDIAKAQKHVHLTKGNPKISTAEQIESLSLGWDQASWDESHWNSHPQIVAETNDKQLVYLETVIDKALIFIESEMFRLKI